MAFAVSEKNGSGTLSGGDSASAEKLYIVTYSGAGTNDEIAAKAALEAAAPATYNGLTRTNTRVSPITDLHWEGEALYGDPQSDFGAAEVGDSTFEFETSGGTQHVTQSRQTIASYASGGGDAPDFRGAINVTPDGVEGVDIVVPTFSWSETHVIEDAVVTNAYKGSIHTATGRVNSDVFRGFNPGELLFMGAQGRKRGDPSQPNPWDISFRFAASPNATGLTVGDITGIDKKGWEYLWVLYEPTEDGVANTIVRRPRAVYIEKLYLEANFAAALGI